MGKLRFTLTNIIFWAALTLSCFWAENINLLNSNPQGGFGSFSSFVLPIVIIGLLICYLFLEHKKNGLKHDKILLPVLFISLIVLVFNVFRQVNRSFIDWDGTGAFSFSFSLRERITAALQIVSWIGVLYCVFYCSNRFNVVLRNIRWLVKAFLIVIVCLVLIDVIYEWESIINLKNSTGLQFLFGHNNVWAMIILSAIISCLILLYDKFNILYYAAMILLCCFILLTKSTTSFLIGLLIVNAYTLFEIISNLKKKKKNAIKELISYLCVVLVLLCAFIFVVAYKGGASWIVSFIQDKKETLNSRFLFWKHILGLISNNQLDFIFGLGHQTGDVILKEYVWSGFFGRINSAHNGVMEIVLRYGILGGIIYIGILALIVICLIINARKKNYRFAFVYGLAFVSIMFHSLTESTTIFTPNVQGMYFGLIVALPILNILHKKRFDESKKNLIADSVEEPHITSKTIVISLVLFAISVIVAKYTKLLMNIDLFDTFVILVSLLLASLLLANKLSKNSINNRIYYSYRLMTIKENNYEK